MILTGYKGSMFQYESLRAHVARDAGLDLVVIGDSFARQSVDMPLLIEALGERGRPGLRGYNVAAGGISGPMLSFLTWLVYGAVQPEYCILVTAPVSFSGWSELIEPRSLTVAESPYGVAFTDPVRWRGVLQRFLLDHVGLFTLRFSAKQLLIGGDLQEREAGGLQEDLGFTPRDDQAAEPGPRARDRLEDSSGFAEIERSLAAAIDIPRTAGAQVWLVEGVTHPDVIATLKRGGRLSAARRSIAGAGEASGATVLLLPPELSFEESEFADWHHLGRQAAARYTRWLAGAIQLPATDRADGETSE
jgi:hypothetical protein